ncbi:MAG TPA: DUF4242 domain-containing protein [Polyangiaceae bacterium]
MQNSLKTYEIERTIVGAGQLSDKDLEGISTKSNAVLRDLGPEVQWVQSYVTGDKIYCVYRAKNPDIIREHARCGGFPVDSVNLVSRVIDPTTGGPG